MLFADLVSYTSLAESRDTEDVRALLSEYFEVCKTIVRRYGGTVEKFIGDAVMAVWGVPSAHEDDAERAVRAGLSLIEAVTELGERLGLPELAMRAGVVTGEVSTTVGATDQGMVAGDPVNTASRVQAAAGTGELWVDDVTRSLTAAAVAFVDVGEHVLKGKAEPLRLFRATTVVTGAGGEQRVDGLEAPLAGRDRELRMIKELFHATEESERPRLVLLDGDAGLGKTRLAGEFWKYVDGLVSTVWWHQGRCLSYGEGVSYWALSEAVRTRLGLLDAGDASGGEKFEAALREYVPDDAEREWIGPRLASLLGAGGEFNRDDLFAAWTRFFERVGASDPIALVIDDAQYADEGLLGFLEYLLANARVAIFVLLLARPELREAHPTLGGRRATVVRLDPLSDAAMATMVDGLVSGLPAKAREELVSRAEGVPLYAVETVRTLIDRDLVVARGGRYAVADDAELDLSEVTAPPSLQALIAARLDALTPDERRVVADASVLGLSFTRDGIELLCSDVADLESVLESLRRKEIIATDNDRFSADRGQYRFIQAVVRQVAYAILSRKDRKRRHLQVADFLSSQPDAGDMAVVIATHLRDAADAAGADDPDSAVLLSRAVELLQAAGERACALGSYADGLRIFTSALERTDDPERQSALQLKAAEAALEVAALDQAQELATAALRFHQERGDLVRAAYPAALLGTMWSQRGELAQAIDLVRPIYENLRGIPDSAHAQLQVLRALAVARNYGSSGEGAMSVQREALHLAEQLGDVETTYRMLLGMAVSEDLGGSPNVARALLEYTAANAARSQSWRALVLSQFNLADITLREDPRRAREHADSVIAVATEHGLQRYAVLGYCNLAQALWVAGEWDELVRVIDAYAAGEAKDILTDLFLELQAHLLRAAGRDVTFVRAETADDLDDPQLIASVGLVEAYRAVAEGDLERALLHAERVLSDDVLVGVTSSDLPMVLSHACRVAFEAGDPSAVERMLEATAKLPTRRSSSSLVAQRLLQSGRLAARSTANAESIDKAVDELSAAVEAFTSYDAAPYRAHAHEYLAEALIAQGNETAAQAHLVAAREIYGSLGASNWLKRIAALEERDLSRT